MTNNFTEPNPSKHFAWVVPPPSKTSCLICCLGNSDGRHRICQRWRWRTMTKEKQNIIVWRKATYESCKTMDFLIKVSILICGRLIFFISFFSCQIARSLIIRTTECGMRAILWSIQRGLGTRLFADSWLLAFQTSLTWESVWKEATFIRALDGQLFVYLALSRQTLVNTLV